MSGSLFFLPQVNEKEILQNDQGYIVIYAIGDKQRKSGIFKNILRYITIVLKNC